MLLTFVRELVIKSEMNYMHYFFFFNFSALLDRVFLRIGSAESDEQLQSAVSKFLPPVLLKLSSQQDGVRKKVRKL